MNEKTSTKHKEWLKKERPQTFAALQDTEGDSEDLKSCCVRLEREVEELREENRALTEAMEILIYRLIIRS